MISIAYNKYVRNRGLTTYRYRMKEEIQVSSLVL